MKVLVVLLAVAAIAFGIYYYLKPEQAQRWLRDKELITSPEVTRVYRWQDGRGNWHVSNSPPPGGVAFEVRDYRSDENILPLPPQLRSDD